MSAELGQFQHQLETMARRLKQLKADMTAASLHTASMMQWSNALCDATEAGGYGDALYNAAEDTRTAVQAAHIDLLDAEFACESAQLRAYTTGRLLGTIITLAEAVHEA